MSDRRIWAPSRRGGNRLHEPAASVSLSPSRNPAATEISCMREDDAGHMTEGRAGLNLAKYGAIAGWLTLAVIVTFSIVGPQIIAGQRVSGTLESSAIQAYYRHPALRPS